MSINDEELQRAGALISPTSFLNLLMNKVQNKHQFQIEPWFRGTVSSYDSTGKAFVTRTGQAIPDEQPYSYLGVLPLLGQDVYLIRVNGGKPIIVGPVADRVPNAYCWKSTASGVANNTSEAIFFDVFRLDTHAHFNIADLSKFRPKVNGVYLFGGNISWDPNDATSDIGRRLTDIRKNGVAPYTTTVGQILCRTAWYATESDNTQNVWGMDYLETTDWLQLVVFQNSGSSLNVNAGGTTGTDVMYNSSFWAVYVAPPPYWL